MIHFCLAHTAYHFSKWLPKRHGRKLQLAIIAFGICTLLFQLYVLLRPQSSQYCNQPLLYNLVGSIAFTFITTGLALLLVLLEPLPWELQVTFPVFGIASFAKGVYTTILTAAAAQCAKTTPELYHLSLFLSLGSIISAAFFSFLGLFWLVNLIFPGLLLNKEEKEGVCYEPVSKCSCLWHI